MRHIEVRVFVMHGGRLSIGLMPSGPREPSRMMIYEEHMWAEANQVRMMSVQRGHPLD
jgi:hypothetical protein